MSGDGARVRRAWVGLALVVAMGTGCSSEPTESATTAPWVGGDLPEYCSGDGGELADFWEVVHASCRVAQDGDEAQGAALQAALGELSDEEVAEFRQTFRRLNRELRPIREVADDLCAPGVGLGQDLGTDYRSWVIAHGQAAYEAVLADPERLRDFPDAETGCGMGELFFDAL